MFSKGCQLFGRGEGWAVWRFSQERFCCLYLMKTCVPFCLCSWMFFVSFWHHKIRLWLEENLTCCTRGLIGMQQWHEWNCGNFLSLKAQHYPGLISIIIRSDTWRTTFLFFKCCFREGPHQRPVHLSPKSKFLQVGGGQREATVAQGERANKSPSC